MRSEFIEGQVRFRPHTFELPLNYQNPNGDTISVFARELVDINADEASLPWLVYFQGGPGFPSPRVDGASGWVKRALKQFRILLLDQRGTGNSSVITFQTLQGKTPQEQTEYLSHFRADNIVRDAEAIREKLGVERWSILGQSFGGFCSLTYLSMFPEKLERSLITGGVPSLVRHADDVYRATYKRVTDKNNAFFAQFPSAQTQCQKIADFILDNEVILPNGQPFTVEQFQLIGANLGRSGANVPMYYLLENAFVTVDSKETLSFGFLNAMLHEQVFHTNPIYALLHESIYNQGEASSWSAHRVRDEYPEFHYQPGQPFLFTGEMVYPWMFDQFKGLQPLKQAADLLAEKTDWGSLYDVEKLASNTVPVACAVYADDMYVEMDYSRETLAGIPNSKAWITNEYEHNGIGVDGERILDKLLEMTDAIANLPKR
ncbi:Proline iminopeptidase [Vibrio nigripulchritudo SOn1]|uniref:Proline iminopeptidase n=1 Tax=Vibrio nigripulchritudo SOn1 TaxID=1238450 RepID=A0AAV2VSV1_9VIBR|nr:alpha/beta fold hydrolase [Vibrio nigripulchritudo]CCO47495.1 Proline iminopeptidase [Vibrio nigripulchritudo SOn1]